MPVVTSVISGSNDSLILSGGVNEGVHLTGSVFFKNTGTAAALTAQESEIKFSTFAKKLRKEVKNVENGCKK